MYLGATKHEEVHLKKSNCGTESQISQPFRARVLDGDTVATRYITVVQQPNGGNTVTVFKGYLQPGGKTNHNFSFQVLISQNFDNIFIALISSA